MSPVLPVPNRMLKSVYVIPCPAVLGDRVVFDSRPEALARLVTSVRRLILSGKVAGLGAGAPECFRLAF